MNSKDIEYIKNYFINYSINKYFHNGENFHILIGEVDELYQLNSDHEEQGIELETLEEFKIRFKSFTGEEFDRKIYLVKYDKNNQIIYR